MMRPTGPLGSARARQNLAGGIPQMKNIALIGVGYVGLVSGACLPTSATR